MKAAPVAHAFREIESVRHRLVHTGQHYDPNMSDVFFEDLGVGKPDLFLGVGSGSHAEQTARVMIELERVFVDESPEMVIVYGDVNSTLAAALVATKLHIPVAHVEAGLRSFDRRMPEEINRIVVDRIASIHFVTEESGRRNLLLEGTPPEAVHLVGNTMIDSLARLCERLGPPPEADDYVVVTLHRPSNVDDPVHLESLMRAIEEGYSGTVVFPVHPRTRNIIDAASITSRLIASRWRLLEPAGYKEFIGLVRAARGVITDSGGIQEETTWLGVPCLTLRETTERPITVEMGTNVLVGVDPDGVRNAIASMALPVSFQRPPLWDGNAAQRIVRQILLFLARV